LLPLSKHSTGYEKDHTCSDLNLQSQYLISLALLGRHSEREEKGQKETKEIQKEMNNGRERRG
jgi:hypothetical protein